MERCIRSVCTYCGVGCEIEATVSDNRVQKIRGAKDGPVSRGRLCVKGKKGYGFLDAKDRIKGALVEKDFAQKAGINPEKLHPHSERFFQTDTQTAAKAAALGLQESIQTHSPYSHASIGGARTSCENGYFFQKFTRQILGSPNIDSCARICHSPSLKGMKAVIGEGAATNDYDSIFDSGFLLIIGSNTTQAHPIVSGKMLRSNATIATVDIRQTQMAKKSDYALTIPFESNLMIVNMLSFIIIQKEWYDKEFVHQRTSGFDSFAQKILSDPYADPAYLKTLEGYEDLYDKVYEVAYRYAHSKSMIFWGLGVSEHEQGSKTVMAISHLALITGNIGKEGAGLMPLRGQNNVQGTCDMGCLPYFGPDYSQPKEIGLMTPEVVDAILEGRIKTLYNMGEDLAHVHPNQNKMQKALRKLDLIVVNELFENEITRFAHVVFGVKSAYEKQGVYINAERRMHLSSPLVESSLPDDWEVLQEITRYMGHELNYFGSGQIWQEIRRQAPLRFSGASYEKLARKPMQWPVGIHDEGVAVMHRNGFKTDDRLGHFHYHGFKPKQYNKPFVLSTGRTLAHYNNGAQTRHIKDIKQLYAGDLLEVSPLDKDFFDCREVILQSSYGQSAPLQIVFNDGLKKGRLFTTFHDPKSRINFLFGDECDDMIKTARFKAVEVDVKRVR
ncbi:MAG: molybdopterin oxidoreductase family protein [Campylobacterota bacterium]